MRALVSFFALSSLSLVVAACGSRIDTSSKDPSPENDPPVRIPPASTIEIPKTRYDAGKDGFVVHEWGTLTSVVGSDGSSQPGLHHEEEDLPAFVADRVKQAKQDPKSGVEAVNAKMETPVTYFYSPTARTVSAKVSFPSGIFTQWYPFVQTMSPPVLQLATGDLADRYTQSAEEIPLACRSQFGGPLAFGLLDWSTFDVLAPETTVELPGALGKTTWGFARNTASNSLRVRGQNEKFLFYRGLGNYEYPIKVGFEGSAPRLTNGDATASMSGMFLMNVTKTHASFVELGDLGAAATRTATIPEAKDDLTSFVATLKAKLAARLVQDGLYTDEALAMVDTWERSYFLTPGVRLLYLLPQSRTDALIPLEITPKPDVTKRTMVIRVEIMEPSYEKTLSGWLKDLATGSDDTKAAAKNAFLALGRFAEPHLTRVVSLTTNEAEKTSGNALLTEVRAKHRWAPTAAE